MIKEEANQLSFKCEKPYFTGIHTVNTEWIKRDRIETVLIDVNPDLALTETKNLFLYLKNKSPSEQKSKLEKRSIFRRLSRNYKSERGFRYLKLDDFELINKDNMVKDGITPFYWAEFEGYGVKDLGTQSNNGKAFFNKVDLSKNILLIFLVDLSLFNITISTTKQLKENALLKSLKLTKKILDLHDYKYTENLIFFYNKKSFTEKLKTNDFSHFFQNYKGCNNFLDCANFLRNEIAEWFKKGRKRYDVTVIFKEKKELCGKNIATIMDFSKLICQRNVYREYDML